MMREMIVVGRRFFAQSWRRKAGLIIMAALMLTLSLLPMSRLKTFAATKKVRVLMSESYTYYGKEYATGKIKYMKNGLVKKHDFGGNAPVGSGAGFWHNQIFYYNNRNQIKKVNVSQRYQPCGPMDYKFIYDKKGHVKKVETWGLREWSGQKEMLSTHVCKYNQKGQLVEINDGTTSTVSYGYIGSRVTTESHGATSYHYKYDKKGNYTEGISTRSSDGSIKNYYQGSKLVKRDEGEGYAVSYTYKTIKVNKKLLKQVKAQQWALLNNNLNFALGPMN